MHEQARPQRAQEPPPRQRGPALWGGGFVVRPGKGLDGCFVCESVPPTPHMGRHTGTRLLEEDGGEEDGHEGGGESPGPRGNHVLLHQRPHPRIAPRMRFPTAVAAVSGVCGAAAVPLRRLLLLPEGGRGAASAL